MARTIVKLKRKGPPIDPGTPDPWRHVGERLLKGAKLIWQPLNESLQGYKATRTSRTPEQAREFASKAGHFGAFFVLAGLAVENFLKSRIIERRIAAGRPFVDLDDVMDEFPGDGHNLVSLARCANIPLTPDTTNLLERLTTFVRWAGRYPTPKKANTPQFERTTRETDLEDIERFIAKIQLRAPLTPSVFRRRVDD